MIIRDAALGDAEEIRAIYNAEVLTGTATFDLEPRSSDEQREWLTQRSGVHVVLVAVDPDTSAIMGFASLSPYKERAAYRTTVENSVYISEHHRGRGVGRGLLEALVQQASEHGFHTVIARIGGGDRNPGSIALHSSVGFEPIGVEREVGRKFGQWLDVNIMQLVL